jgi:putative transposase
MRDLVVLLIHFIATLARLLGPGGARSIVDEYASDKAPTPDPESLPAPIAESRRVGPTPGWFDGALGASYSSAPVRNRTEALKPVRPSQGHKQAKYRMLFSSNRRRKLCPKGPSAELIHAVVEM